MRKQKFQYIAVCCRFLYTHISLHQPDYTISFIQEISGSRMADATCLLLIEWFGNLGGFDRLMRRFEVKPVPSVAIMKKQIELLSSVRNTRLMYKYLVVSLRCEIF